MTSTGRQSPMEQMKGYGYRPSKKSGSVSTSRADSNTNPKSNSRQQQQQSNGGYIKSHDDSQEDNNINSPSQYYYYNSEPHKYSNTTKTGDSTSSLDDGIFYTYEKQNNGTNEWTPTERRSTSHSPSGKTNDSIPQLKRNNNQQKTSTPKKGEVIRAGSSYQINKEKQNNKRNSVPNNYSREKSSLAFNRKLSNSIALPIVPIKKIIDDSFERKLSNSIAIPGLFDEDKDKSNKKNAKTKASGSSDSGVATQEPNPNKTTTDNNRNADQNKNSEKTTDDKDSSEKSEKPSNIDETGENAKLLSVRRIDTPDGRKSRDDTNNSSSSSIPDSTDATDVFLPKRYILAIMMFMGFVNLYAVRVNLNVAIGAMVNNHTVVKDGVTVTMPPEFDWSSRLQGVVLGSFYYGYMILQIPGGYFALKYGGTKIFGVAVFLASILTLLTPVATRYSVWALVVLRILEGLVLGVMLPCNHQIWSCWAPLAERTTLVTIAIAGMNVGTVITMPLTGLLTKYGFDGGWASVFYCFGVVGIIWYILWVLVVHPTPATHPTISKKERQYIENNTLKRTSTNIPWKTILKSRPVWAVIIGNVANDWGLYTILICLPIFLMDIMKFNVQTMGFVASLPFLLKAIVGPVGGVIADLLRYKYMSTANVRRLFYFVGAMTAAVLIVIAGYSHSPTIAVASMCIGVAMSGLLHSGYEVNVLDIAPGLAGIVMGITNTAGTTMGFLSPLFIGFMTENKRRSEWITVFWITFAFYAVGTVLFCLLLSGEAQHWAVDDEDEEARDQM